MNEELREAVKHIGKMRGCASHYVDDRKDRDMLTIVINLATQVLNASEVMEVEHISYCPRKEISNENCCCPREWLKEKLILAHTKLMLAKEEEIKKYSNKLQGELQKNESLEQQIAKLQCEAKEYQDQCVFQHDIIENWAKSNEVLKRENEKLRAEIAEARKFIEFCLESIFEGCGIDGGDAQDKLESLGLIELRPIPEEDSIDGEKEHYFTTWTPNSGAH